MLKRINIKEINMLVILIVLIIVYVFLMKSEKIIDEKIKDNQKIAAFSQYSELKKSDYKNFEFISEEQFIRYQIGCVNEVILYCETIDKFSNKEIRLNGLTEILIDCISSFQNYENDDNSYITVHINLKNSSEYSGLFNIKPICQIMLDNGIYDDALNDKFTLVDMSFDTDVEGYTLANVPADNGKINTDMGFVRTDDWSKHFFRVYIESNSEISYTCVFRTPKEYADDENLVIGKDDSHASRRWDGEKEVTYDNGGYRIYINRQ